MLFLEILFSALAILYLIIYVILWKKTGEKQDKKEQGQTQVRRGDINKWKHEAEGEEMYKFILKQIQEQNKKQVEAPKNHQVNIAKQMDEQELDLYIREQIRKADIILAKNKQKHEAEQEAISRRMKETEVSQNHPVGIKCHFNGYDDLPDIFMEENITLTPLTSATFAEDVPLIRSVTNDEKTKKCMPLFCGLAGEERFADYLQNTYVCTELGLSFAYAVRKKGVVDSTFNGNMLGFIKVSTPSHNVVTNNFNGWLIDFLMFPEYRGHKYMKKSVAEILKLIKTLGAKDIYAMVDVENLESNSILCSNGFKPSGLLGGRNPHTHNAFSILICELV